MSELRAPAHMGRHRAAPDAWVLGVALCTAAFGCSATLEPVAAPSPTVPAPVHAPAPLFTQGNASCGKRLAPALTEQTTVSGRLEVYDRACDLGCAEACDGAGTLLRTAPNELGNDERARAHFERACTAKLPRGCLHLGELRERPPRGEPDATGAEQAYERACDLGDGDGCAARGELLEAHGSDRQAASREYSRGCALDSGRACAKLAEQYETGDGVLLDSKRAFELYEHACEHAAAAGCSGAARMLESSADAANLGRFERKAAELDTQDCNDGEPLSCTRLGDAYRDGRGVEKDVKRAARLYALGCEGGVEVACEGLKRLPAAGP